MPYTFYGLETLKQADNIVLMRSIEKYSIWKVVYPLFINEDEVWENF